MEPELRFRFTTKQRWCMVGFAAALWALCLVVAWLLDIVWSTPLVISTAVTQAFVLWFHWPSETVLSPHGVHCRGGLDSRYEPWGNVRGISVRWMFGSQQIVLHTPGRRLPCSVPATGRLLPDPEFDQKVDEVVGWWVANRGEWWVPDPRFDAHGVTRLDLPPPPHPPPPYPAT
jgi:hypothetical protein